MESNGIPRLMRQVKRSVRKYALLLAMTLVWVCRLQATSVAGTPPGSVIKEICLVHFSHTDVGFTDSPSVCRELYCRYLDIAVDTILDSLNGPAERRFFWTAEATMPVYDWWQSATPARRKQFLEAVRAGQLEVTALAYNNTPFMNGAQWRTMLHWLPDELWQQVDPKVAIQNDVNGMPRAGALLLLDRGVCATCSPASTKTAVASRSRVLRPSGGKCPTAGGCLSG